jgi:hypothetical protein
VTAAGPFDEFLHKPTGGLFDIAAPSGVVIAGGATFVFDRQGGTPAAQNITVGTQTITVEAGTGYAH